MIDIVREFEATQREVGKGTVPAGEGNAIRLRRTFSAPIDDVWDAVTNPERIGRWFMPIAGDLRLGGTYQLEGNAGGEILACDPPNGFRVTWVFGPNGSGDQSHVEVRLARAGDDATSFELEHIAIVPDEMWDTFGPGAVGVGWDGGVLGLGLHLTGLKADIDPNTWHLTDEGHDFYRRSSEAWGAASLAAGIDPATVERNVAATFGFYAPPPES
jgi:uncharacterized protein YndB with AHSA1/START domain